jgi:hypothetical protein
MWLCVAVLCDRCSVFTPGEESRMTWRKVFILVAITIALLGAASASEATVQGAGFVNCATDRPPPGTEFLMVLLYILWTIAVVYLIALPFSFVRETRSGHANQKSKDDVPQCQFHLSTILIAMLSAGLVYPLVLMSDGGEAFLSMAYTALGALALGIVLNEWRIRREKKSAPQHWSRRMRTGR